jgi:hypothetical protein
MLAGRHENCHGDTEQRSSFRCDSRACVGFSSNLSLFQGSVMRAFAARWGFRYIGPSAPPQWWWNPAHFEIRPPLPAWISHFHPCGQRIRQAWNVIEGQQNGITIFVLDTVIGEYRGGHPCTLVVCHVETNPFGAVTPADRVAESHGWTILHGTWLFWFCWTMGIKRIEGHMNALRASQQE